MPSPGGARPGAGRPKTTEKHRGAVAAAEQRIADRLPDIADALIVEALAGDVKAAIACLDRIMGKAIQAVEHSGEDGGPIRIVVEYADDTPEAPPAAPGPGEDPGGDAAV